MIVNQIPKIKKSVKDFVEDENGIISKNNILKIGIAAGSIAILIAATAYADHSKHTNDVSGNVDSDTKELTGTHTHHSVHTQYSDSYGGGGGC